MSKRGNSFIASCSLRERELRTALGTLGPTHRTECVTPWCSTWRLANGVFFSADPSARMDHRACPDCVRRFVLSDMARHEKDDRLCTCRDNKNSASGLCFAFKHKDGLCYSHYHQRECVS